MVYETGSRYTNALLNQAGHFSAMEGGMGGLAGTQDQRIAAHSFYFKFFTQTDTLELAQFGAAQISRCQDIQHWPHCTQNENKHAGAITHFDANIYGAISGLDAESVTTANAEYEDNTYGWLYQLAKSYAMSEWRCTFSVLCGANTAVFLPGLLGYLPRTVSHIVVVMPQRGT